MSSSAYKPKIWVLGDLNAFFGLFTNVLLNTIVLTSLTLYVVHVPETIVYGRMLPALGVALMCGNLFYAYLAYKKSKSERRDSVAALPYGPSVPPMFLVTFAVMLPCYIQTKDAILAWKLGLVWALIVGAIIILGALVGPTIRKYTPRAAMLGTLAGVSVAFISLSPAFQMFNTAWIGMICFMIIIVSWLGNSRLPFGIPGGLAAILVGSALAWGAVFTGYSDIMSPAAVPEAFKHFGVYLPKVGGEVLSLSWSEVGPLLVTAIPLGIYSFTEAINNIESAAAAGDEYDLRSVLIADGLGAVFGAFAGSPFPPAVYIGHPGWKAIGGRIGYSMGTGIGIGLVCIFGLTALLLSVIPLVAILPILLFIGLIIGSQAFQETPRRHAPAIILAFIPNVAEWAKLQINGAVNIATNGGHVTSDLATAFSQKAAVHYHGMSVAGGGSTLAGLMLGAIAVFIIEKRYNWATVFGLIATVLSFLGFIHGEKLEFNANPTVTSGYLMASLLFAYMAYQDSKSGMKMDWSPVANDDD